jgi:hypothetical protein
MPLFAKHQLISEDSGINYALKSFKTSTYKANVIRLFWCNYATIGKTSVNIRGNTLIVE